MVSMAGRVVLITGAAGGLGSALSQAFAEEGCRLFLTDKNEERLCAIVEGLAKSGVEVSGDAVDLSGAAATRNISEKAFHAYGRIDVLVNNAGVSAVRSFWDLNEEDWDLVLDVNVKSLFFMLQATAKRMLEQGGSIINIASVAGRLPRPTLLHYAASKAAVISITRSAALALADNNIRVNAVAPGMMDTKMLHSLRSDLRKAFPGSNAGQPNLGIVPLGRVGQPAEIARTVLYLASDASAYITGQTLNVCGGISMN